MPTYVPAPTFVAAPAQPQGPAVPVHTLLPPGPPVLTVPFLPVPEVGVLNDPPAVGYAG